MGTTAAVRCTDFTDVMEENKKDIRELVMKSYYDMDKEKGREYKDFFAELESRYKNV